MSGHKKVFDENISGLPDLTIEADPQKMLGEESIVNDDDLILEDDTPDERFMKPSEIFVMRQKKKKQDKFQEEELERNMQNMKIKKEEPTIMEEEKKGISKDIPTTNIELEVKEDEPVKKTRGKRGKDKKVRKKRVLTETQKAQLAAARKKSLEVRRAKAAAKKAANAPKKQEVTKTEPIPIPPPNPPSQIKSQMSFDYFCDLMDRYEERKRKKVSVSQEPHPNKKIPHYQKPRPPVQRVQRSNNLAPKSTRRMNNVKREEIRVTPQVSDFSAYSILKNQRKNIHSSTWGY